jgi:L-aspartate oxidase
MEEQHEIVVVGAGIAGLVTALSLAPLSVTIIANARLGQGVATGWSQGGIAAALAPHDKPANHAQDTIYAAAGIADVDAVQLITEEAPNAIHYLSDLGVPFDRDKKGGFALSREAAHSHDRIVRVSGDRTGPGIMAVLGKKVSETKSIQLQMGCDVVSLATAGSQVVGVWVKQNDQLKLLRAKAVILATGGIGHLYRATSNPPTANGAGLTIAARAGARLADLEFVQFHPTTLAVGKDPSPLATEALRGAGSVLVNSLGKRFMVAEHPMAELAPRDIVARAIFREIQKGQKVYLDSRKAIGRDFPDKFPQVYQLCQEAGIDPVRESIPVEPAAHYHMGGIATDNFGRTSLSGLWACGEVASTGAHGANRLASNSLLEAIVYGKRIAGDIKEHWKNINSHQGEIQSPIHALNKKDDTPYIQSLRTTMTEQVGLIRDEGGLIDSLRTISNLKQDYGTSQIDTFGNMLLAAQMIAYAALKRCESRGSHFRADYPVSLDPYKFRQFFTLAEIRKDLEKILQSPCAAVS